MATKVRIKATDVPRSEYDHLPANTGNGVPLAAYVDEEKQQRVNTVFHNTNTDAAMDILTHGYHYPTTVPSMWEWASADSQEDDQQRGYRDLLPSGATEFIGTFCYVFAISIVTAISRLGLSAPYLSTNYFFPYMVPVTAMLVLGFVHSTMWMHSVNLFPALSFIELFSPHSWKRYTSAGAIGWRWTQAVAMMFVQWAAQFIATILATWVAWLLEDDTFHPLQPFLRGGLPVVFGAGPVQAGFIVAFAFFIYCIAYYAMTLENYRNTPAQTRSLYAALTMGLAYFISFKQTSAIFSAWQPLASGIITGNFHSYNSDAGCGGGASCFSNASYWAINTFPAFIAAALAYLAWFFILRLTSMSARYSISSAGKVTKAQ